MFREVAREIDFKIEFFCGRESIFKKEFFSLFWDLLYKFKESFKLCSTHLIFNYTKNFLNSFCDFLKESTMRFNLLLQIA